MGTVPRVALPSQTRPRIAARPKPSARTVLLLQCQAETVLLLQCQAEHLRCFLSGLCSQLSACLAFCLPTECENLCMSQPKPEPRSLLTSRTKVCSTQFCSISSTSSPCKGERLE